MSEPKIVVSTTMMGQISPRQWQRVIEGLEHDLVGRGIRIGVGLEVVAAMREPLLSLLINRIKRIGLGERVVTVHGRVDYDLQAIGGRMRGLPIHKRAKVLFYDLFMAWVGESYRATMKLPRAKLLLHAPTLFQLEAKAGPKPKMLNRRLVVENDEHIVFPFGDNELALGMQRWGDPLNPVDVLAFAEEMGLAKMVFDTAHFWRCFPAEKRRERLWRLFCERAERSSLPIYWHLNHDNGKHFVIRRHLGGFVSRHDEWLSRIVQFMGKRVKEGRDQVCFEEPVKLRLRMSKADMDEVLIGVLRSVESLREYGGV
ncbi:MAG: hypothetical protein HYS86_01610 [Candidatus Chisholmbacteria bacterium]|nr:hypothetical protein [Candidatus Chisholmbacteria bacterium]